MDSYAVRGQYERGWVLGEEVTGYREEKNVDPESVRETFVALKLFVDNWRWAGVPFYIRAGKRMPKKATEVAIQFHSSPHTPFARDDTEGLEPNVLVVRVQPEEGLSLKIGAKVPGSGFEVSSVNMDLLYGTAFLEEAPDAYQRLLLDLMLGDPTLFIRADEAEGAWRILDPVMNHWSEKRRCTSIRRGPGDPRRRTSSWSRTEGNGGGRDRGVPSGPRRRADERRADRARAGQAAHQRRRHARPPLQRAQHDRGDGRGVGTGDHGLRLQAGRPLPGAGRGFHRRPRGRIERGRGALGLLPRQGWRWRAGVRRADHHPRRGSPRDAPGEPRRTAPDPRPSRLPLVPWLVLAPLARVRRDGGAGRPGDPGLRGGPRRTTRRACARSPAWSKTPRRRLSGTCSGSGSRPGARCSPTPSAPPNGRASWRGSNASRSSTRPAARTGPSSSSAGSPPPWDGSPRVRATTAEARP